MTEHQAMGTDEIQPFAHAVRWPIDADEIRLRLSDRLVQSLPALRRRFAPRLIGDPAGSRLRRWLLTRVTAANWAAFDRRDWDYVEGAYAADIRMTITADAVFFDLPGAINGWPEARRMMADLHEGFAEIDQRPVEIIDPGGPFLIVRIVGRLTGVHSGLDVEREFATLYEITAEGVAARQWIADLREIEGFLAARRLELEGG